ncbi:MAG: peptidoglycan-binding protein [Henriciella sp.]|uniref:peptidoglycan-binding protein n=1 Tax=Henriciella sp. TaxID=1968823 RepID=UPI003C734810
MSNYGPWSVKGIDQRAREAAREAAREEGLTIGEYINRMLLEETADEAPSARDYRERRYPRAVEPNERPQGDSFSASGGTFDRLIARLEAVEARSTLALTGIDQSIVGLVTRLNRIDTKADTVADNVETTLEDLRATHDALQHKVKAIEEDDSGARNLDTLKSLEQALGKLASHIYDENSRRQDETDSVRARVETGLEDMNDRVAGMERKVETTLTDAAQRVEKKVEQAELRAEGTAKHLSERFSELETNVSSRLAKIDNFQGRVGAVEGDVAGALTSIESVMTRMQDRLQRAETMTNSAMTTLESTFENLDQRINAIAEQASPEKAEELRNQFESRFEGLADELRSTIEATRTDLAQEIEKAAAAGASPDALKDIESSIGSLEQRVTSGEERSNRALENMTEQVGRISSGFDTRLREVEARDPAEAVTEVRRDVEALSSEVADRLEAFSTQNDEVIDKITGQMKSLADEFDRRVEDSEQRSASAIEQVGEQVASVAQRLQARQDRSFEDLRQNLEVARKKQDVRLSDALSGVSDRLERMQNQQVSAMSPVQKAIASLATRLEALEDFTSPPHAELGQAEAYAFETPEAPAAEPEDWDMSDTPDPADDDLHKDDLQPSSEYGADAADDAAIGDEDEADDMEFMAGLPELEEVEAQDDEVDFGFEDEMSFGEDSADFAEPEEENDENDPLSALVEWDDGRDETRDSDIFADEAEPSFFEEEFAEEGADVELSDEAETGADEAEFAVPLDEDEEPVDYLTRARRAAMAANDGNARKATTRHVPGAETPRKKKSKLPLVAAVSVVALATATAGTLITLRGLQDDPGKPVVMSGPETSAASGAEAEAAEPVLSEADEAAIEDELFEADTVAEPVGMTDPSDPVAEIVEEPEATTDPAPPADAETAAAPAEAPQPVDFAALPEIPNTPTLESSASNGDGAAQLMLGEQRIDAGDYTSGPTLVRRAAEAGEPAAQYRLAKLHEKGLGVPRDLAMAREWTEQAAEGGNVKAMHDLAVYYAEGDGGPQSYAAAAEWFRKAADFGLTDSQYNLAVLYEAGLGISPSASEALYWYEVAARQGDEGAPQKVAELRTSLSLEIGQQAQRRAAAWSPAQSDARANGRFASQPWQTNPRDQVQAIQTVLAALGYEPGPADGIMGTGTVAAIRDYQSDSSLEANGQISQTLVDSLNATVEAAVQTG